jgi:hypothetical protein
LAKNSKIEWDRLGIEAAAIVASILLAFWIDAWWEDRQNRELESQHLSRLRVELVSNIALIDDFELVGDFPNAAYRIIESIEEAQRNGSEMTNVGAGDLFGLSQARNLQTETSVFDGLVRSGGIEVIRDQSIVSALAAWEMSIRDYADLAAVARTTTQLLLLPALHSRTETFTAFRTGHFYPLERVDRETQIQLRVDSEIKGLIAQKTAILAGAGRALAKMRAAAQSAVDAIDAAQVK